MKKKKLTWFLNLSKTQNYKLRSAWFKNVSFSYHGFQRFDK